MYQRPNLFQIRTVALLTLFAHPLLGGVVLDGSFGTHGPLPGSNFMITANVGRLVNTNLFQSFSQFNLNSTESATFTGPSNVHNILARVTSGSSSSIDGTIRSDIPGANLFFMNPAGVLFGQHAQLDVSGSFAVTTANYLKLVGGGRFNANLGGGDVLTSAPVSAFGFLNSAPASVSFTGSALNIPPQKVFSAVAGNLTMSASQITGQGSRVNLVSVNSPGEVQLDATNLNSTIDLTQFTALGNINLNSLALTTSGPRGGPVVIRGGNLIIQDSSISAFNDGRGNGGDVTLTAESLLSLRDASIGADTEGSGNGGNVTLTAKSLVIDGSLIRANTNYGGGNAGNITLTADSLLIQGTSRLFTNTYSGNAGNITLTANSFFMEGNSNSLEPFIESIAVNGDGSGGDVTVTANSVFIGPFAAIVAQTFGEGDPGSIFVNAGTLQIKPNGFISTSTFGSSVGGNITIVADSVLIDGTGEPKGPSGNFATGIFAQTERQNVHHPGNGGDITVTATDLVLQNGGAISAQSFVSSAAGSVRLEVGMLSLESGSTVSSANIGSGPAGSVVIHTHDLMQLGGGSSVSTLAEAGDAGSIEIIAGGKIKLSDHGSITASAGTNGGNIHITAPELVYLLNSEITAAAGINGGSIIIDPTFIVLNNSLISANAAQGRGGNIDLISAFFFSSNSLVTATGTTNGTVNITAPALDLGAELITLPVSLLSAENQLQERCTALLQGDFSSFISIGRGGTEPAPEELQEEF